MATLLTTGAMRPQLAGATRASAVKRPGHVPDPSRALGTPDELLPFDHVVVVMMENHSFDNYLGMLPRSGQPRADGFTFDDSGRPVNANPLGADSIPVFHESTGCGTQDSGSQSWNDTHTQIDGGTMDGFARTGPGSMGYWTSDDLPFYYSLAKTFTLANRWFCSAPCQTYPNRRFLMAGTAYGNIATTTSSLLDPPPPNGTIWDRLHEYGVTWLNYFSDAPSSGIILSTPIKYPANIARIEEFYVDCAAGTLPAVSLVDCDFGVFTSEVGDEIPPFPVPLFNVPANVFDDTAESEENPNCIQMGEAFVARVVNAVVNSPAWRRTLLVWLYDEHGGYYDHVPPPAAIAPDDIPPDLGPGDAPGGYNIYGPRVPAVVVSPYSRRNDVTNVVHDHTSILATIEAKWNIPALTYRDANASTMLDFLDLSRMTFADPPDLAAPANPVSALEACYPGNPEPPGA
jgi:phospholipase C